MELTALLIYESLILAVSIAAVGAFALFYFRLLRGYNALRLDHDKLKKELDEYGNVITASSKEHIAKLVAHSQELSSELKNELSKLLVSQAQKESGAYEAVVQAVGKELEERSEAQVQEFVTSLQKEVAQSEQEIRGKIANLYDDARVEVEKMRADARLEIEKTKAALRQELEEKTYGILQDVVAAATGKLLSKEDSTGLVREVLEQAIRQHGLGGEEGDK